MVSETGSPREENLAELLVARARGSSDERLAIDVGVGGLAIIATLLWRPRGWILALAGGACFAAYGMWGIADRELRDRLAAVPDAGTVAPWLRLARLLAAVIGIGGAVLLIVGLLGIALGTMIS